MTDELYKTIIQTLSEELVNDYTYSEDDVLLYYIPKRLE